MLLLPDFGDSASNAVSGQACAGLLKSGATIWSCVDRDPLGKMLYFLIPYLISDDPVSIDYYTLAMKCLFLILFYAAAQNVLIQLLDTGGVKIKSPSPFCVLLVAGLVVGSAINNIPVRLGDLEAACFGCIGVALGIRFVRCASNNGTIRYLYLFGVCIFFNMAGLMKLSFFVHQFSILIAIFACLSMKQFVFLLKSYVFYFVILLANAGLMLQMLYSWTHYGTLGLTNPAVLADVARVRTFPYIAMEIYTIPQNLAYMTMVTDVSHITWFVAKLAYAVYHIDPYVYGGKAPLHYPFLEKDAVSYACHYIGVFALVMLISASLMIASRPVRLTCLFATFSTMFMLFFQHVEPRYYILPRLLFALLTIYWAYVAVVALRARRFEQIVPWSPDCRADRVLMFTNRKAVIGIVCVALFLLSAYLFDFGSIIEQHIFAT